MRLPSEVSSEVWKVDDDVISTMSCWPLWGPLLLLLLSDSRGGIMVTIDPMLTRGFIMSSSSELLSAPEHWYSAAASSLAAPTSISQIVS